MILQSKNFPPILILQSEEIFLDMFEDEYRAACRPPPKVEFVLSDASLLLPPTVSFAHSGPESRKKSTSQHFHFRRFLVGFTPTGLKPGIYKRKKR